MAKQKEEGQRDQLFDMNVGDGLIEVNVEEKPVEKTAEEIEAEAAKVKAKTEGDGFTAYEDGSFEIDDQPASEVSKDADDEEEGKTFIEKTGKTKTPSADGSSDSSSSSPYLAFAKDRANEGVFLEFTDEDWTQLVERNDGDEAVALRELSTISMREMVKQGVEGYKESITPEERTLYEAKERGLPLDEYSIAKRSYEKYSKITEDDLSGDESW